MASGGRRDERATPSSARGRREYRVAAGRQELKLALGEYLIGRSNACHVILNDGLVSRRHAALRLDAQGLTLRDLGSSNGVYVNGVQVGEAGATLGDGDRIRIGREELIVRIATLDSGAARKTPPTLPGEEPRPPVAPAEERSETRRMDAFEIIGPLAATAFAEGRPEAAEQLLSRHLDVMLAAAKAGTAIPEATRDTASRLALDLAVALARPSWFDYVLELHSALGVPCADPVIDALDAALVRLTGVSVARIKSYVAVLRSSADRLETEDLLRAHRIERLALRAADASRHSRGP